LALYQRILFLAHFDHQIRRRRIGSGTGELN